MDSQSGVWGAHFQLSRFLVPFKITDLHLRVKQTKAVTIVSKGTDYEENIPGTTRDKELTCARDVINGHNTLRHHAPPTAVEHLARSGPCRFLWRVWEDKTCPNTHLIIFS